MFWEGRGWAVRLDGYDDEKLICCNTRDGFFIVWAGEENTPEARPSRILPKMRKLRTL